jgi:hypothetical protein
MGIKIGEPCGYGDMALFIGEIKCDIAGSVK